MEMEQKIDLMDAVFTIPFKIDSKDRIQNIICLIAYIDKYFNTNIHICEQGTISSEKIIFKKEWSDKYKYSFEYNKSPLFHKTKLLNLMAKEASVNIIISYDTDVVFYPHQYLAAANKIRSKECYFCYPFDRETHNIPRDVINKFYKSLDLGMIEDSCVAPVGGIAPGGCIFMDKEKFFEIGMENERFISWGPEDRERLTRIQKFGFIVGRVNGKIFHMDHVRTLNSSEKNCRYEINKNEYNKIMNMSLENLKNYTKQWR